MNEEKNKREPSITAQLKQQSKQLTRRHRRKDSKGNDSFLMHSFNSHPHNFNNFMCNSFWTTAKSMSKQQSHSRNHCFR